MCCQEYKHLPDRTLGYEVTKRLPIYCQKDKHVAFAALELFNWPNANLFFAMCTSLPGWHYTVCTVLLCRGLGTLHFASLCALFTMQ